RCAQTIEVYAACKILRVKLSLMHSGSLIPVKEGSNFSSQDIIDFESRAAGGRQLIRDHRRRIERIRIILVQGKGRCKRVGLSLYLCRDVRAERTHIGITRQAGGKIWIDPRCRRRKPMTYCL